jgi:RNA polymerase sigma-70 factor (ECF subfamily)
MPENFDLRETIQAILNGDQEIFRVIIKKFSPEIRVFLSGHLKDSHKVDDLCQETFIAIYWNLSSYDASYSFKTWIRAIARNKLMSHFRSHYSHQKMMAEIQGKISDLVDREQVFQVEETELVDQLVLCINKQDDENLELLKQRYFDRESVQNMAEKLNTTVSAISSQLYRLRKQLKVCIEKGLAT